METTHKVVSLDIEKLDPNPFQPRRSKLNGGLDDLLASIPTRGLLEPIGVRPAGDRFDIIYGHRRKEAVRTLRDQATDDATRLKYATIPAYIRENVSDAEMLELALIENIQRNALTPLEIADGLAQIRKLEPRYSSNYSLAEACHQSEPQVRRYLKLASAPPCIREFLELNPPPNDASETPESLPLRSVLELIRCYEGFKDIKGAVDPLGFADQKTRRLLEVVVEQKWSTERLHKHIDGMLAGKFTGGRRRASTVSPPIPKEASESASSPPPQKETANDSASSPLPQKQPSKDSALLPSPHQATPNELVRRAVRQWWKEVVESGLPGFGALLWFAGAIAHFGRLAKSLIVSIPRSARTWVRAKLIRWTQSIPADSSAKKTEPVSGSPPQGRGDHSKKAA